MKRITLPLVLLTGLVPTVAHAQVKISVFDLQGASGAAKAASRITHALRRQVGSKSSLAIVPGKSLAEVKLVFGCPDRPISAFHKCIAKVGRSLKADRILLGRVRYRRGTYKVVLTLLTVNRPLRPKMVSARIPAAETRGTALSRHAALWLASLLGVQVPQGRLSMLCSVDGVDVSVDGDSAGTCGQVERTIQVKPGVHEVSFSKEGFEVANRSVTVSSGQTSRLNVTLRAKAGGAVGPRRRVGGSGVTPPGGEGKKDGRMLWKALFYTTVSVGAALLVGSIITGVKVKSLESDKRAIIRASWDGPTDGWITDEKDACAHNKGNPEMVSVCNDGVKYANITNALIGVGAALVAGSGYFLYRAYFSKDSSSERPSALRPTTPRPARLIVAPQIYERGGGVSAVLRF